MTPFQSFGNKTTATSTSVSSFQSLDGGEGDRSASASVSGAFGGQGRAVLQQAKSAQLSVEEPLQSMSGLRLISVTRIILKTVGEHQLHI